MATNQKHVTVALMTALNDTILVLRTDKDTAPHSFGLKLVEAARLSEQVKGPTASGVRAPYSKVQTIIEQLCGMGFKPFADPMPGDCYELEWDPMFHEPRMRYSHPTEQAHLDDVNFPYFEGSLNQADAMFASGKLGSILDTKVGLAKATAELSKSATLKGKLEKAKPEPKAKAKPEPKAKAKPEPKAKAKPASKPASKPVTKLVLVTKPVKIVAEAPAAKAEAKPGKP